MIVAAIKGDLIAEIERRGLDAIMNAANGIGPMGKGIAGAIRRAGGKEIQDEAFRACKDLDPQPGDAYYTSSGRLAERGCKCVVHAVTMKKPAGHTDYEIVRSAFESGLELCKELSVKRVGCTAFGTATGGLDPVEVADIMVEIANACLVVDVVFADIDKRFIDRVKSSIGGR